MMGVTVLQIPLPVLTARATTVRPQSLALFGFKRKRSNALRQRSVSRTATQEDCLHPQFLLRLPPRLLPPRPMHLLLKLFQRK